MWDFIYDILYSLTKVLLRIIDCIMQACNKISGIEDITVSGKSTDFITYLITDSTVEYAFAIASLLGIILIVLLTIIQIIISYTKEKNEESPAQIAKKAAKNIVLLLLVPTFMYAFIILTNAFMKAMYQATMVGSSSLPQFMFAVFGEDAADSGVNLFSSEYTNLWSASNSARWNVMDMSDFDFFYSYIIGGVVVYMLLSTAMMLVERAISIVLLYIVSPFVVASSVMDDGAKFKAWRDQVLIKFLTGHGAILAINIYMMVVGLIIRDDVVFFDNGTLNNFLKLLFILGGAFSIKQVQAIIGNLIQVGAGDKAVAENAQSTGRLGGTLKGIATAPFRATRSVANFGRDWHENGFGSAVGSRLGFKTAQNYGKMSETQRRQQEEMHADQAAKIKGNSNQNAGDATRNAINGTDNTENNKRSVGINDNSNNRRVERPGENAVNKFLNQSTLNNNNNNNNSNANNK